jgi:hypothetical protein
MYRVFFSVRYVYASTFEVSENECCLSWFIYGCVDFVILFVMYTLSVGIRCFDFASVWGMN